MTASPRSGVRRDVQRNRALLIAAADRLIAEHGLELSFNAIAKEAGVGVGTVYRHFAGHDELIDALLDERVSGVVVVLESAREAADPVAALHDAIIEICELQAGDRGVWEAVGGMARQRASVRARLIPVTTDLVERARATGRIRSDVTTTDVEIVLWTGGALSGYLDTVGRDLWRRYIEALWAGLVEPGHQPDGPDVAPPTFEELDRIITASAKGRDAG